MPENKRQALHHLIANRVKMLVNPQLGKTLTKNTISDIKYRLITDPILQQCTSLHLDIFQHKTDPMSLKILDITKTNLNNDWNKL